MAKKNKGLNMDKVNEISKEVMEVMEVESTTPVIVQEMAEHVGASLEDIDALREMIVEEQMKEIELIDEVEEMVNVNEAFGDAMVAEYRRLEELKVKISNGIRYAILSAKDFEDMSKYRDGKQIIAIFKAYKHLVKDEMSDMQKGYIKMLNNLQLSRVLHTLNIVSRQESDRKRELARLEKMEMAQ